MSFRIGIDLGTTYCALARIDPESGNPIVIENRDGGQTIPSAVYFRNGMYSVGMDAKEMFEAGDDNCAVFFKRMMGEKKNSRDAVCFVAEKGTQYERSYTAVELSALLLMHLKEEAEAVVGDTISEAVITCPAYFYDNERDCILRAAALAGLRVQEILEEPLAAAIAYGLRHWRAGARILVYDLGGGTFDITLIEMDENFAIRDIGTRGRKFLGGKDFDETLQHLILRKFTEAAGVNEDLVSDTEIAAIRGEIEGIKKKLSDFQSVTVSGVVFGRKVTAEITRNSFEEESNYILSGTGRLIDQLFKEKGVSPGSISDVLLVGGSTLMPCVRRFLTEKFGKPPLTHVNPATAVALGAAVRTLKTQPDDVKLIGRQETVERKKLETLQPEKRLETGGLERIVLHKTATHTMGVIAISDDGLRYVNEPIILSGTTIPCKSARKFKFYTSADSGNELEIYVLQGDSEKPLECNPQSKYIVSGIRHMQGGEEEGTFVRIQYSYDKNGIIRVQARQEDDEEDLPIRKEELPQDMSRYGEAVQTGQSASDNSFFGIRRAVNKSVAHKYKEITFSNVTWKKYDKILFHESGEKFNEPAVHVVAEEKNIEFHGYNISQMDEGVFYGIDAKDDFEIECNIDTSAISPHPGGNVTIRLGIITACLTQNGGDMLLDGKKIAAVGSRFKLKMSVKSGGLFELYINDALVGSKEKKVSDEIELRFGLSHDSHYCSQLSHAYISNIEMKQWENKSAGGITETWE